MEGAEPEPEVAAAETPAEDPAVADVDDAANAVNDEATEQAANAAPEDAPATEASPDDEPAPAPQEEEEEDRPPEPAEGPDEPAGPAPEPPRAPDAGPRADYGVGDRVMALANFDGGYHAATVVERQRMERDRDTSAEDKSATNGDAPDASGGPGGSHAPETPVRYYVHFERFPKRCDQWVTPERVRPWTAGDGELGELGDADDPDVGSGLAAGARRRREEAFEGGRLGG